MEKDSHLRKAIFGMGLVLLVVSAVMLQIPGTAQAQEKEYFLEDTVVTATKMGETLLQETPIAMTVFDDEALKGTKMFRLSELDDFIPNLVISLQGSITQAYIRGVGTPITGYGAEGGVGVYVDGVYIDKGIGATKTSYFDVERIEVLRGPQGTLYGRNTTGGAINIITKPPTDELDIRAGIDIGSYSKRRVDFSIGGPILEGKINGRFTLSDNQRDGYMDNLSGPDGGDQNATGYRGRLDFVLTDRVEVQLSGDYTQRRETDLPGKLNTYNGLFGQYWAPVYGYAPEEVVEPGLYTQNLSHQQIYDATHWGVSAKLNIELSHEMNFSSITAYRENESLYIQDADYSILPIAWMEYVGNTEYWSQELQLDAKWDRLDWVLGLYYYDNKENNPGSYSYLGMVPLPPFLWPMEQYSTSRMRTNAWAAYGQATYAFTDKLSATLGLRYGKDEKDGWYTSRTDFAGNASPDPAPIPISDEWSAWTPKFVLDYNVTDEALLYASAAKGWKSGLFFTRNERVGLDINIAPETNWTYEIGAKTDWFEKRLRANLTLFYTDYIDIQVDQNIQGRRAMIQGDGEISGAELELTARPFQGLTLNGAFSTLDSEYTDMEYPELGGIGTTLGMAPEWKMVLGAAYTTPVADYGYLTFRGSYTQADEYTFTVKPWHKEDGYSMVNASILFETADGRWSIEAYGTNLGDEEYLEFMYDTYESSPPPGPRDEILMPGLRRMFGLQVVFNY